MLLFLWLMCRESCLLSRKQMPDTYSDWLVSVASINSSGSLRYLFCQLIICKEKQWAFCIVPLCWTLAQIVCMLWGNGRKIRSMHLHIGAAFEGTKHRSSFCARHSPFLEFLLHHSSPAECKEWSEQVEPCNMAAGSSARLLPGRPYSLGPQNKHIHSKAAYLQSLFSSKNSTSLPQLVQWVMPGLPKQKRGKKIPRRPWICSKHNECLLLGKMLTGLVQLQRCCAIAGREGYEESLFFLLQFSLLLTQKIDAAQTKQPMDDGPWLKEGKSSLSSVEHSNEWNVISGCKEMALPLLKGTYELLCLVLDDSLIACWTEIGSK